MGLSSLLVQGGTVVTSQGMVDADVLVRDDVIQAIGEDLPAPDEADVVEAGGLLVLPGIIDAHTHIQLDTGVYQTPDNWFVDSKAAAFGGVTTVIDFATQFEGQGLDEALEARLEETAPSVIDYALHMMVTDIPRGEEDRLGVLPELGVSSIKLYTTYRPNYYADDATILRLLEAARRYGILTLVHCENDALVTAQTEALVSEGKISLRYHGMARSALAEEEAAARVLFLADAVRAPVVIVHNSSARTSALVAQARACGQEVYAETAPQYLILDNTRYEGSEPWRYILQPPLRDPAEKEGLWDLLSRGEIDMVITDHCDYTKEQKLEHDDFTKTPGGLPGVETLLPLMATYGVESGRLTWPDLARLMAENPARIYGLWPRKGVLRPGADADIVLYDPAVAGTITADDLHTIAGYTPYEGMRVKGHVVTTIRRGEILVHEGEFLSEEGRGKFIPR